MSNELLNEIGSRNLCDRHNETMSIVRKLDDRVSKLELSEATITEKLSNLMVSVCRIEGIVERSLVINGREFDKINSRLIKVSGGAVVFLAGTVMWYIQNRPV